jgi:plasmid stabilization system protein ParE
LWWGWHGPTVVWPGNPALGQGRYRSQVRYLKQERGTARAKKAYTELMDKLALLATQPRMGSLVPELVNLGRLDYRILVHETHTCVLYRIVEDERRVDIHMVFGGRQDFQEPVQTGYEEYWIGYEVKPRHLENLLFNPWQHRKSLIHKRAPSENRIFRRLSAIQMPL